jgi:hypothetical protein
MGVSALGAVAGGNSVVVAEAVSCFPKPRGIGRDWVLVSIAADQAEQLLAGYTLFRFLVDRGVAEARAWRCGRGKGRGGYKRIDVAFGDGSQASIRFLARSVSLRLGQEPCR